MGRPWGAGIMLTFVLLVAMLAPFIGMSFEGVAHAAPIGEVEPNDTAQTSQSLSEIGFTNPVSAGITSGDSDWYRFSVHAGESYVVEVFDVAGSIDLAGAISCDNVYTRFGLRLEVFDTSAVTEIAGSCTSFNGAGNVHNSVQFKASLTGAYYIRVLPHSDDVSGNYSLRVLPQYNQSGAAWDTATYEPNNWPANAYAITPGFANALEAQIEERNPSFSTSLPDQDWYRFNAKAGETYVVEIFDVAGSLALAGRISCDYVYTRYGLRLEIFDPSAVTEVAGECATFNGVGNVHNSIQFKAGLTGSYYIRVLPHAYEVSGAYKIRVLPMYGQTGAAWDTATFEPNNWPANAYLITPGDANALGAQIDERNSSFSTSQADRDWYRLEVVKGKPYTVELFDVDASLSADGDYCSDGVYFYTGLRVEVYDKDGSPIAGECSRQTYGDVHDSASFKAGYSGYYLIKVIPQANTVFGNYKIRVVAERAVFLPLIVKP